MMDSETIAHYFSQINLLIVSAQRQSNTDFMVLLYTHIDLFYVINLKKKDQ